MENKIAIIGIIVKDHDSADCLNSILHEYSAHIIGRMGLPYKEKDFYIISIVIDGPHEVVEKLASKIAELEGVSAKTLYA